MHRLQGSVALITGAASGIGAAIALAFAHEGAHVILCDINDRAGEQQAASIGEQALYRRLDVRVEADWTRVTDEVYARYGKLDVLVNNAGITGFEAGATAHDPEHASLEDWHRVFATNVDGTFLGCKHAIRVMKLRRRGSIINISSRSGLVGVSTAAAYAASKAAVRNHTKSVALYCAEQGWNIRCNSIHPAAILTPMWEPMLGNGEGRDARMRAIVRDVPMQRFGTTAEVAAVAVMLASDEAAYMTGSEINLDGGLLAGSAAPPRMPGEPN
ncbi:glucose 1-dehydrogenase [Granulicella cerasi]|uniref:Glucose 1-dehydrogenase n=1 Tax=Granulicella cerasi TaxID=741063 RepID=A0ABW1ZBA5_9BACT|nr:glucose 1-dehydrogenase [Granulicella cerasi]